MNDLTDITENLGTLYHPTSALVFYQTTGINTDVYVEHFDMDKNGSPINAHPLTVKEAQQLSKALNTEKEKQKAFLNPKGIIPTNILYINPSEKGAVVWHTKPQKRQLYFVESLDIPSGEAYAPPLLWYANKNSLYVFALGTTRRPNRNTPLYHAPFFNVYESGNVCMGTVDVNIKKSTSLEAFIFAWEDYFFNSYFSHLMQGHNPVKGNCTTLWKNIIESGEAFPKEVLKPNNRMLKHLLP